MNFHFLIHYRYPKLSDVERTFKGAEIQTGIKHLKTSANIANIDNKVGNKYLKTILAISVEKQSIGSHENVHNLVCLMKHK